MGSSALPQRQFQRLETGGAKRVTSIVRTGKPSTMRRILMAFVQAYRFLFSPWVGAACRFTPTCSAYALEALAEHGAGQGSYLTLKRLARCHPWCEGGHDPVPLSSVSSELHLP